MTSQSVLNKAAGRKGQVTYMAEMRQLPRAFQGTPREGLRPAAGAQRTVRDQGAQSQGRILPKK